MLAFPDSKQIPWVFPDIDKFFVLTISWPLDGKSVLTECKECVNMNLVDGLANQESLCN